MNLLSSLIPRRPPPAEVPDQLAARALGALDAVAVSQNNLEKVVNELLRERDQARARRTRR